MTIDELLTRGVGEIIIKSSLESKLKSEKKLRVKLGIDPTGPEIHLGHAVPLRKLKAFQEMGHTAVFIVGDFTARIGDPSEKEKTRKPLTLEEVKKNAEGYFAQAFKIIDKDKTEVHMQSEWYEKMDLQKLFEIVSQVSVAQLMEHETFKKRIADNAPFSLLEMMYPILQGYDSVMVKADVEIGASEQKFNLLMGRQIQKLYGQPEQDVLTLNYLIGLDGKEKMSKSLGNYIAISDGPQDMYGKVMSIPDNLIMQYFKLCTDLTDETLKVVEQESKSNPRDTKAKLAKLIVEMYHSESTAEKAAVEFDRVFKNREKPKDLPAKKIEISECRIDDLLMKCELATSKSEAKRLIEQGGVEIEGEKITDFNKVIQVQDEMIVQVGKRRFVKIGK
jgi:tyrosyl-tRNA synthetase